MTEYKIPKRTQGKRKADITNKDLYNFYLEQIEPVESISGNGSTLGSYKLSSKEYSDILKDLNDGIINMIILENFEFKMPFGLGTLSMVQKKVKFKLDHKGELNTKNLAVNYKETIALWNKDENARLNKSLIFHTNEHTNGNRMIYYWSKKVSKCSGLNAYGFLACRSVKRKPGAFLKDPDKKLTFFEKPITKAEQLYRTKNIK